MEHADGQQAVIDTAIEAARPTEVKPEGIYRQVVPAGATGQTVDLEKFLSQPRRTTGAVKLATVGSFIEYVKRHEDLDGATTVWVHPTEGEIRAVLNDHEGRDSEYEEPPAGWGDHRANLDLIKTPEWERWTALDGRFLDQQAFAEHVEQSVPEIVTPDGAEMLEIAQSFHATTNAEFRSATRLADGTVQMQYDEEVQASAGQKGELTIPTEFVLAIAPFIGEEPQEVKARLRYRVRGGDLAIGYQLDRPYEVIRQALDRVADELSDNLKRVYLGEPRKR